MSIIGIIFEFHYLMKKLIFILFLGAGIALNAQVQTDKISLYPNPSSGSVNVVLTEVADSDVTVTISDILGNKIQTFIFKPGDLMQIQMGDLNLKNGIYLFKIETGSQSVTKRLVLKQ